MALTTDREGMRKALDAMRIGRDPRIAAADFILTPDWAECYNGVSYGGIAWGDYGLRPGDKIQAEWHDHTRRQIAVRVTLREEAPTFVDLMAA